jgi:hypothetical protein
VNKEYCTMIILIRRGVNGFGIEKEGEDWEEENELLS